MMKREYQKPLIGWKTMYEDEALLDTASDPTIPFADEDEEEFTGGGDAKPAHFSVWEE
ncbi:MAG: hypothetical protein IKH86_05420 [Prevotella sp.]|nr:hypothetical protein [Prevotella sp.]